VEAVIQGKHGLKTVNLNRRRAIREQCLNCSAWVTLEVRNCEYADCSLWPYRMGTGKQEPEARKTAIREYCPWCVANQPKEVWKCPTTDCPLWQYRKYDIEHPPKIDSTPGKGHIGPLSEDENKSEYLI